MSWPWLDSVPESSVGIDLVSGVIVLYLVDATGPEIAINV